MIFGGVVVDDANVVLVVLVSFDATVVLAVPSDDIGSVVLLCTVVEIEVAADVDIDVVVVVVVFVVVVVVTALWFKALLLGIVLLKFFFDKLFPKINFSTSKTSSLLIRNYKFFLFQLSSTFYSN